MSNKRQSGKLYRYIFLIVKRLRICIIDKKKILGFIWSNQTKSDTVFCWNRVMLDHFHNKWKYSQIWWNLSQLVKHMAHMLFRQCSSLFCWCPFIVAEVEPKRLMFESDWWGEYSGLDSKYRHKLIVFRGPISLFYFSLLSYYFIQEIFIGSERRRKVGKGFDACITCF